MKILTVQPQSHCLLAITAEDGRMGLLDVRPYLDAFETSRNKKTTVRVDKLAECHQCEETLLSATLH